MKKHLLSIITLCICQTIVMFGTNLKIVTVTNDDNKQGEVRYDAMPIDSTAVTAFVNTSTKELTLEYGSNHIASNVDIYRNGQLVASEYQGIDAGDTMKFNLSGSGDYEVVVDNYDETSDEELTGTFTIE